MKKLLIFLVLFMVIGGTVFSIGCNNSNKNNKELLSSVIENNILFDGVPVTVETNPTYNMPTAVSAPKYKIMDEQKTGMTGEELTVNRESGSKYGGGQFIAKLFTEAFSRAPLGKEFSVYQQYIVDNGLNTQTCIDMAHAVFESDFFKSFELNKVEIAFVLYRAILSRDPSFNEVNRISLNNYLSKIDELIKSSEFAAHLESMAFGPYGWGKNNTQIYTGGFECVYTADDFNKMIADNASTKTVVLPQGALIVAEKNLYIPEGYTIKTEGNPNHYAKFARFINKNGGSNINLFFIPANVCLQNIFVDGNRQDYEADGGANITINGDNCVVWGCRSSDSIAYRALQSYNGFIYGYMGYCLTTQYGTSHSAKWRDGIGVLSHLSIVEYCDIVDSTDAGLVLFRALREGVEVCQSSIVRYNKIINVGNSAYAGLDYESIDQTNVGIADLTGCIAYENELYTSYVAHMHMAITLSSRPWTESFKKVKGNYAINNFTSEGCFVNTAGGIIIEGAEEVTVHGNQLNLNIGAWTYGFGGRWYAFNSETCTGDVQPGYLDCASKNFISPSMDIEKHTEYTTKKAYVYEDFVDIPANWFNWEAKE